MEIAAVITAVAALITGVASFLMIMEMKRQRTATSRPVLKIISLYRKAKIDKDTKLWSWDGEDPYVGDRARLKLMNFGTGPALNVTVVWDVDLEALLNALRHFDPYGLQSIGRNGPFLELGGSAHMIDNQRTASLDAVPVSTAADKVLLAVPTYFVGAYAKYIELAFLSNSAASSATSRGPVGPDFPTLFANCEYEEINGVKMKQRFSVQLLFAAVKLGGGERDSEVDCVFEVKEVGA